MSAEITLIFIATAGFMLAKWLLFEPVCPPPVNRAAPGFGS